MTRKEIMNSLPKNHKVTYYCQWVLYHTSLLGEGFKEFRVLHLEDLQPAIDKHLKHINDTISKVYNIEYGKIFIRTEITEFKEII